MSTKKSNSKKKKISKYNVNKSSYASLLYGIITVIILFLVIFFGFKIFSGNSKIGITDEAAKTVNQEKTSKENIYEVKKGDSLWSISEKLYNDGYSWVKIAQANNISNPDLIEPGTKIKIPSIQASSKSVVKNAVDNKSPAKNEIAGDSYTVKSGDDLWDIAVRAYGDGYKWVEIAKANNLLNPDLIHSGNVFKIPR